MEKKNLLLQPIFRDLKSVIKHMTYTEEYKMLKDYFDGRMELEQKYVNFLKAKLNSIIVSWESNLQGWMQETLR